MMGVFQDTDFQKSLVKTMSAGTTLKVTYSLLFSYSGQK